MLQIHSLNSLLILVSNDALVHSLKPVLFYFFFLKKVDNVCFLKKNKNGDQLGQFVVSKLKNFKDLIYIYIYKRKYSKLWSISCFNLLFNLSQHMDPKHGVKESAYNVCMR